jgi:precorrin-6Y C5,15-methyltransferase (decarboxylating)
MEKSVFSNSGMLNWLGFFANKMDVKPEKIKMLDICGKVKNVVPTIDTHKRVMIFVDESHEDLFFNLWEAGFGEYEMWYGEGSEPGSEIVHTKIEKSLTHKITGPTVVLIVNEKTRESARYGMKNDMFTKGSVHYVGNEIRAVIMSILGVDSHDTILALMAESIVIEAAIAASEGTIIAVEPDDGSRRSMEENVEKFGVHNVQIVPDMSEETLAKIPVPRLAFIVANKYLESDIERLLKINPNMQFVIYTLDLGILADTKIIFDKVGIKNMEAMQISVSKTNKDNIFVAQPAPWLITGGIE